MATYTAATGERAVHAKTLTAATVDTVTLGDDFDEIEVIVASSSSSAVFFTTDGTTPTVAGGNTYSILSGGGALRVPVPTAGNTVVKLISAGAPTYGVTGISR